MSEAVPPYEKIIRGNRYLVDPSLPDDAPGLVISYDGAGRETERRTMVGPAIGFIYVIQANPGSPVKIGFTTLDDVTERMKSIQTGNPYRLHVVAKVRGSFSDEQALHRALAAERLTGEWFALSTRTEALILALVERGVEAAIEVAGSLNPDFAVPADWERLEVAEWSAHVAFGIQRATLFREARAAGTGPRFREKWAGKSCRRFYRVADIARWLHANGIPFHPNKKCWHAVLFPAEDTP